MSRETVTEARTLALFNKFWSVVSQDREWVMDVFRDNPEILDKLLKAFVSSVPATEIQAVISAVKQVARAQAREKATTQVDALSPEILEWVQETLEYK